MEAYHVKETHAGGRDFSEPVTTYDVYPLNVSRFIHTVGSVNPRMPVPPTEQELLSAMWGRRGANDQACPTVPDGVTDEQLAELFITGTVTRGQSDEVTVTKSTDYKCGRCWRLPQQPG